MVRVYILCAVIAAAVYAISAQASEERQEEREFRFPTQARPAARYLLRWLARLDLAAQDAYEDGVLSAERYDAIRQKQRDIKRQIQAAVADGVVTADERHAIHQAMGMIRMELAEARFGPDKPKPERWASREPLHPRLHPRPPPIESGTGSAQ